MKLKKVIVYMLLIIGFIALVYLDAAVYLRFSTTKDGWDNYKFIMAYYFVHALILGTVCFFVVIKVKFGHFKKFQMAHLKFDLKYFLLRIIPILFLIYIFSFAGYTYFPVRMHGSFYGVYTRVIEQRLALSILSLGLGYVIAMSFVKRVQKNSVFEENDDSTEEVLDERLIGFYSQSFYDYSDRLLKVIEKGEEDFGIFSIEYLSLSFSNNLYKDLNLIEELIVNKKYMAHCHVLLRTMLEHVALFVNIKEGIIDVHDYLGLNVDIDENIDLETCDPNKLLDKLGQKRYPKKSVASLCKLIDDQKLEDEMKMYDAYKRLCDYSHDMYFYEIEKTLFDDESEDPDMNLFYNLLFTAMEPFYEATIEIRTRLKF